MKTCLVIVTIEVGFKVIKTKKWESVDVMKTAPTKAWARRQFNLWLKDMDSCLIGKDKVITINWECRHGPPYHTTFKGVLSGVNGKALLQNGIFER